MCRMKTELIRVNSTPELLMAMLKEKITSKFNINSQFTVTVKSATHNCFFEVDEEHADDVSLLVDGAGNTD